MGFVREFFRDKSPAQLLMIAAILLLFASQFFLFFNDGGSGHLPNAMNTSEYTQLVVTGFANYATGWEAHPHAYVILVVLVFAFLRDDIQSSPLFARYGWWASLALVVAAALPGAWFSNAVGGWMGAVAALVALFAVIVHEAEVRQEKAAAKVSDPPA